MMLYKDYCPRCPRLMVDRAGGPPDPSKCNHCSPKGLTETVAEHLNAAVEIEKLKAKITEASNGISWYTEKQHEFKNALRPRLIKGEIRVISFYNRAAILDWTGDHLNIRGARLDKEL